MKKHITTRSPTRLALASLTVLACCLCHNLPSAQAAPGSWTRKADMPVALAAAACGEVDGILYVAGGNAQIGPQTPSPLQTLFAYDPKTDAWTQKQYMPTARYFAAGCAVNGIIYVVGGNGVWSPPTDVVEAYDPKTDTWTTKANLSSPRYLVTVCALEGIIYASGGYDASKHAVATVEAYDPATDQWTLKASLPAAGARGVAQAVDGFIYAFFNKSTFAYNPGSNQWSIKATIPASSLNSAASASGVVNGIVYLFGGLSSNDSTPYNFTLAYDPDGNDFVAKRLMPVTCEEANCASTRAFATCAAIDGKLYIAGGANASPPVDPGAFGYSSMWMFDPEGGVTPQILGLTLASANSVRLAWQGEAGRLYGVESRPDIASGLWTRVMFSTGTNSIPATNAQMEATCTIPTTDACRFFRVLETD